MGVVGKSIGIERNGPWFREVSDSDAGNREVCSASSGDAFGVVIDKLDETSADIAATEYTESDDVSAIRVLGRSRFGHPTTVLTSSRRLVLTDVRRPRQPSPEVALVVRARLTTGKRGLLAHATVWKQASPYDQADHEWPRLWAWVLGICRKGSLASR